MYIECLNYIYTALNKTTIFFAGLSPFDVAKGRRVQVVLKGTTVSGFCICVS